MTAAVPPIHPRPEEPAVRALLAAAGLPTADLAAAPRADFWGCGAGEDLAGAIGLETSGAVAPLRSRAVAPDWQGRNPGAPSQPKQRAGVVGPERPPLGIVQQRGEKRPVRRHRGERPVAAVQEPVRPVGVLQRLAQPFDRPLQPAPRGQRRERGLVPDENPGQVGPDVGVFADDLGGVPRTRDSRNAR
jgi:hypothetical protein